MIIKTEDLQKISNILLYAIDSNSIEQISEIIEMFTKNDCLYLQITNREYFMKVKLSSKVEGDFHATVYADVLLKLISKITTEFIEFDVKDNNLVVKGNGKYNIPIVYEGTEILKLPEIKINNVTNNFNIDGSILSSIYSYNSKQFMMGNIVNPIQSYYYVDKAGAITFTTGACVNKFTLEKDVKLLLTSKLVKLFKLFKSDKVDFTIGQDPVSEEIVQTKVKFKTDDIELTAILSMNDELISKVPVQAIRDMSFKDYEYTVVVNRSELLAAINRLVLFSSSGTDVKKTFGSFTFGSDELTVTDFNKVNSETVKYSNSIPITEEYKCIIDFNDIKLVLDTTTDKFINFNFGNHQAVVFSRGNIYNVVPEVV